MTVFVVPRTTKRRKRGRRESEQDTKRIEKKKGLDSIKKKKNSLVD